MKPKSQVKPYKCNTCGLVLINTKELLKHKIVLHNDRIYQCQSCNKIFDTKYRFENHLAEIHDTSQNATAISTGYDNSESSSRTLDQSGEQDLDNNMESVLFRKIAQEKKARKRTRGPYRKSVSSP
jgi:Zinc finger, C2H2 type